MIVDVFDVLFVSCTIPKVDVVDIGSPMKLQAVIVPFTSNVLVGLLLPIPTLLPNTAKPELLSVPTLLIPAALKSPDIVPPLSLRKLEEALEPDVARSKAYLTLAAVAALEVEVEVIESTRTTIPAFEVDAIGKPL